MTRTKPSDQVYTCNNSPSGHVPSLFPTGEHFRVEVSSVENPQAFRVLIEESAASSVTVHRISQGSGIQMLTDSQLKEMIRLGGDNSIEVSLWAGPRASWGTGVQPGSSGGRSSGSAVQGSISLQSAVEEVIRGCSLGLRSVLIADLGLLSVVGHARSTGRLPRDLTIKTSVSLPAANPASAKVLVALGADSINLPTDLTLSEIAEIRAAVDVPLDIYLEAPDDLGGAVRHHEAREIIRVSSPVYIKFAVRNAPPIYPIGAQGQAMLDQLIRERVRRAALVLESLSRAGGKSTELIEAALTKSVVPEGEVSV